jgi:hypothetical protein
MKRRLLSNARRPVPSGRVAHSARVLPVRACFALGRRHRLPVRGSALPGCFTRHCSPPTGQITISCPRNLRVIFVRYSRNGHNLADHCQGTSAPMNLPRPIHVHELSIAFAQPHTFPVHVQTVTPMRLQSVHNLSEECPRCDQWFSRLPHERYRDGSSSQQFPRRDSAFARNRAGCLLEVVSFLAASQLFSVRRTFLLAFRVAFLALSGGRPNLSRRVLLSGVVVLPLGALAAAPGCVQMLRIFCLPRVGPALASLVTGLSFPPRPHRN